MKVHLLCMPVVKRPDGMIGPILPKWLETRSRGWGQASSLPMYVGRLQCVWARATDEEIVGLLDDELDVFDPTMRIVYEGEALSEKDGAALHDALVAVPPDWQDWCKKYAAVQEAALAKDVDAWRRAKDVLLPVSRSLLEFHRSGRDEWIDAYRGVASVCEKEEAGRIYGTLATLHQDTFTRTNGDMNGSTMSDGLGTWAVSSGSFAIVVNQAVSGVGTGLAYDSAQSAVDEQQTTITNVTPQDGGPIARWIDNTHYYNMRALPGYVMGRNGGTAISGTGSTSAANDIEKWYSVGSSHTFILNGVTDLGPVTDATHATGVAGVYSGGVGTWDNFLDEIAAVASSPFTKNKLVNQAVNRASTY